MVAGHGVGGNLAKIRELMHALSPGICDSKFHGGVMDLVAKGSQATSYTLPLTIWLDNFEETP